MKKKISFIGLLFLLTISTWSCDNTVVFEENQSFENNTWNYDDTKIFTFNVEDTIVPIRLYVNLRTTLDYEYANLWVATEFTYPNGTSDVDTLQFFLCEKNGKWLGKVSGTVIENKALITQGYLKDKGTYTFKMNQAMYNNDLGEILDIGIRVEKIEVGEKTN